MTNVIVQTLIALIGTGGLLGGIVAILKVNPEKQTAAVSQAQGAMETMQQLNDALREELKRQSGLNKDLEKLCDAHAKKLEDATKMITQLQQLIHGVAIMEDDRNFPPRS